MTEPVTVRSAEQAELACGCGWSHVVRRGSRGYRAAMVFVGQRGTEAGPTATGGAP